MYLLSLSEADFFIGFSSFFKTDISLVGIRGVTAIYDSAWLGVVD
jgi:hypothetical protein